MHARAVLFFLCLLACSGASGQQEEFHLKSDKTGRVYGPFVFTNGAPVLLGQSKFAVVRKERANPVVQNEEHANDIEAACAATVSWLKLVDQDRLEEAWDDVAGYMQKAVSRQQFAMSIEMMRQTLGKVTARKLQSAQFTQTIPSAPDGQYVVVRYESVLEKKRSAIETIIPMLDEDGTWRVSGYDVR